MPDWNSMFAIEEPVIEIILRGTIMYLTLFAILRIVLKRETGTVGMTDLLVIVLIADAAQNGMAGNYHTVPDGIILVCTIIFWAYLLDWLAFRFPRLRRLIQPPPMPLIKSGAILRQNLRRELITEKELQGMLREEGIEDISNVKRAYLESDGRLSVVKQESQVKGRKERKGV